MPEIIQIVAIVAVVLIVLYLVINAFSKTNKLTKLMSAKTEQIIKASELKNTNTGNNFTYSMWLYIEDWNYRYGENKTILNRANCPMIMLGARPNSMTIKIKTMNSGDATIPNSSPSLADHAKNISNKRSCNACDNGFACACDSCDRTLFNATEAAPAAANIYSPLSPALSTAGQLEANATNATTAAALAAAENSNNHLCVIDAIPIQKWVNVIVSLYQQTLDVYLEGKLVKTCVLPGPAVRNNNASIFVTPKTTQMVGGVSTVLPGGFSGWTSSFRYMPYASNPQEAYNIYKDGFGGSILANAMSKYRVRFSLIKDNKEAGGFEI